MSEHAAHPERSPSRILYCRCAYANVIPEEVKDEVLERLATSGRPFDTVADLCEMSARRDPSLKPLAERGDVKIAACYPRAVKNLFRAADAPLPEEGVEILNMRTEGAERIVDMLVNGKSRAPADHGRPSDNGKEAEA